MRFSVDGWDPSYGASFEVDGELGESTARIDTDVELPAARWRPIDPDATRAVPEALLFVDGVRRVVAQVWIDSDTPLVDAAAVTLPVRFPGEARRGSRPPPCAPPTRPAWSAAARLAHTW